MPTVEDVDRRQQAVLWDRSGVDNYGRVTLDAAEDSDPVKPATKPAFAIVRHGMQAIPPDVWTTRRFTGLVDLLDEALRIEDYSSLLARIFGDSLDISQGEIAEARRYRDAIMSGYGFEWRSPI